MLTGDVQQGAAGDEDRQARAGGEQGDHDRSSREQMLEVVEDEEEILAAQVGAHAFERGAATSLPHPEGMSDGRRDPFRDSEWGEINEPGAVRERSFLPQIGEDPHRQACLADPARSGQRHQRNIRPEHQGAHGGDLRFPADQ